MLVSGEMKEEGRLEDPPAMAEKERSASENEADDEGEGKGDGAGAGGSSNSSWKLQVFESKKEKKRELLLIDSESDECGAGADQNGNGFAVRKKDHRDTTKNNMGIIVMEKRITRMDAIKRDIAQKKILESGTERKRSREASLKDGDASEISTKKIKTDYLKPGKDKTEEINAKKIRIDSLRRGNGKAKIKANRVSGSKSNAAVRERESSSLKRMQVDMNAARSPEAERNRCLERSGQRMLRMLKDNSSHSTGEQLCVSSDGKGGIRVQGNRGVVRLLPSNKKVRGRGKTYVRREAEETRKNLGSAGIADRSTSKHPSLSGDRNPFKKSGSSILDKSQVDGGKFSPAEKYKGCGVETEADDLSPKIEPNNADNICDRTEVKDKRASGSITEAPFTTKNNTKSEKISRRTEKQKVRDQIKNMLLNAGWKIDMRPRMGRNYEDAVYIPPQGRGSYWSITKAYNVFLEQFNNGGETGNVKGKESTGKLSKASTRDAHNLNGTISQFSAIPLEVLDILKRNVVNKRRSKKELEDDENKPRKGSSGSKRAKHAANTKSGKSKEKAREVKGRKYDNGVLGSSRKKNKKRRGYALLARTSKTVSDADDYVPYAGKRTVLSWMIDSGTVPVNGKVKYMNERHKQATLEGWITRDGIHCGCCSKLFTVSKFEIHAGSELHQPYENIFVEESGISLLQCQLDAWEQQEESERCAFHLIDVNGDDPNDDTCGICGDGGDLICCDGCPSTFHLSCLGIQMLPPGDWHCTYCSCRFCGVADCNTAQENEASGSLLLSCGQCEEKYHQGCIPEADAIHVDSNSSCPSFCGQSCRKLFEHLQKLFGVKNDLEAGFSWTLIQRFGENSQTSSCGLAQRAECNSKIAIALAVMDECFLPIIDQRSRINLIHNVLYNCGSNFSRLNYSGFYTLVLERDDEIISAASIRIHGTRLAEMPFICTRDIYRRQGMCRRLLNAIEAALSSLNIKKLVIPAISELVDTWTAVFGFKPVDDSDKQELKSMNMLVFPGTGLLQKPLLWREGNITMEGGVTTIEKDTNHHDTPMVSNGSLVHSSVGSDLHASDDGIVSCAHEVKEEIAVVKRTFPASGGSVHATEISSEPSDAPCGSDFAALRYKSSETASDGGSFHFDAVGMESNIHSDSSFEPKFQLPCEGSTRVNHEDKTEDTGTGPSCHSFDDLLIQHASDIIIKSPDAPSSCFLDSGETNLHIKSECVVNFPEFMSDETYHNSSELSNKSVVASPIVHDAHAFGVGTLHYTHNRNDEVAANIFVPGGDSGCHTLEGATFFADSVEPNLHASDDCTLHNTDEVKVEIATVKPDMYAVGKDSGQCTSEVFACGGVACQDSETITQSVGPVSEHGLQDSDISSHQDSESLQGYPECSRDAALISASKTSLHTTNGLNNTRCVSSISNSNPHSTGASILQNTCEEINNDTGSLVRYSCALAEISVKFQTLDIDGESLHDGSRSELTTSCEGKSSEFQYESHGSSDAAIVLASDVCKHNMLEMRKDPLVISPCISKSCPFNDTHDVEDGTASVVPNQHAPNDASVC